jgi:hypothetical protein
MRNSYLERPKKGEEREEAKGIKVLLGQGRIGKCGMQQLGSRKQALLLAFLPFFGWIFALRHPLIAITGFFPKFSFNSSMLLLQPSKPSRFV